MSYPFPAEAVPLLLDWYRMNARDLPWRKDRDPYKVLVSEIMLQQTRAETVKPYFRRFIDTLPTVRDLAEAPEAVILKLWEGLGYYSRVRNLQKAAQAVTERFGGSIPADFDALLSLPGVGRYTAGAVASIAYGIPVPAVDGNVLRVMARLCDDDTDVMLPAAKTAAEQALAPHVPADAAGDFTQSLIELGALVCLPGEPDCGSCPLRLVCRGLNAGHEKALPVRNAKKARRVEQLTVLLITAGEGDGETVLIRRRPDAGLLGGLWEFPHVEGHADAESVRALIENEGLTVSGITPLPDAKHLFTHVEWRMTGFSVRVDGRTARPLWDGVWVSRAALFNDYTVPSAFSAYLACLAGRPVRHKK